MNKLKSEAGVIELIKCLDDFYKKDDLSGAYDACLEHMTLGEVLINVRGQEISLSTNTEFTRLYNNMKKHKIELPQAVLAFKLLDFSGLQNHEKTIVLTAVDYSKNEKLLDQMMKPLKKFFGTQSFSEMTSNQDASVNLELTYHTEDAN